MNFMKRNKFSIVQSVLLSCFKPVNDTLLWKKKRGTPPARISHLRVAGVDDLGQAGPLAVVGAGEHGAHGAALVHKVAVGGDARK